MNRQLNYKYLAPNGAKTHYPLNWTLDKAWSAFELRIDNSGVSLRRRRRLLVILGPAILSRLLPDHKSPGANHRATINRNQPGSGIDIERDCPLQFR